MSECGTWETLDWLLLSRKECGLADRTPSDIQNVRVKNVCCFQPLHLRYFVCNKNGNLIQKPWSPWKQRLLMLYSFHRSNCFPCVFLEQKLTLMKLKFSMPFRQITKLKIHPDTDGTCLSLTGHLAHIIALITTLSWNTFTCS